ncbi:MAG: cytochrome b [Thermoplasmataceae archaeon]
MEEKNDYNLMNAIREEDTPPGSYKIALRSITRKEFRIDYWTGSFLMTCLAYLAISGILLFYYFEQGNPYGSTVHIINNVYFGEILLNSHLLMAYAMVVLVYVHMFRNYFVGAYKGKFRWLQWILGVLLFVLVYAESIMGYLLSETYIGVSAMHVMELLVQRSAMGRLSPVLSNWMISLLVGDGTTPSTVAHLLALHVAIVGGLIFIVAFLHFFLFERSGPFNLSDKKEKPVEKKYYPWYPVNLIYTLFTSLIFVSIILILSALFIQVLPPAYGSLQYGLLPFPDWYIMPVYKLMDLAGYGLSTGGVPLVTFFLISLLFIPFIDRYKSKGALERPMITVFGVFYLIALFVMALWGYAQPGLTQTRLLTMAMWWGITFISFLTVYAMRFAKKDLMKIDG